MQEKLRKRREGNVFARMSEDEPQVFGTFVHNSDPDGIPRSKPGPRRYPEKKKQSAVPSLSSDSHRKLRTLANSDIETLWRQVKGLKDNRKPMNWKERCKLKQAEEAPMQDSEFENLYQKRRNNRDVRIVSSGSNPYLNPVNKIFFVGKAGSLERLPQSTRNLPRGFELNESSSLDSINLVEEAGAWQPGELSNINELLKTSQQMTRRDFLEERHKRSNPDLYSANDELFKTVIDIESKDFIKRDESNGQMIYYNVNQPIIEKTASVARSISKDETNADFTASSFTRWNQMSRQMKKIKDQPGVKSQLSNTLNGALQNSEIGSLQELEKKQMKQPAAGHHRQNAKQQLSLSHSLSNHQNVSRSMSSRHLNSHQVKQSALSFAAMDTPSKDISLHSQINNNNNNQSSIQAISSCVSSQSLEKLRSQEVYTGRGRQNMIPISVVPASRNEVSNASNRLFPISAAGLSPVKHHYHLQQTLHKQTSPLHKRGSIQQSLAISSLSHLPKIRETQTEWQTTEPPTHETPDNHRENLMGDAALKTATRRRQKQSDLAELSKSSSTGASISIYNHTASKRKAREDTNGSIERVYATEKKQTCIGTKRQLTSNLKSHQLMLNYRPSEATNFSTEAGLVNETNNAISSNNNDNKLQIEENSYDHSVLASPIKTVCGSSVHQFRKIMHKERLRKSLLDSSLHKLLDPLNTKSIQKFEKDSHKHNTVMKLNRAKLQQIKQQDNTSHQLSPRRVTQVPSASTSLPNVIDHSLSAAGLNEPLSSNHKRQQFKHHKQETIASLTRKDQAGVPSSLHKQLLMFKKSRLSGAEDKSIESDNMQVRQQNSRLSSSQNKHASVNFDPLPKTKRQKVKPFSKNSKSQAAVHYRKGGIFMETQQKAYDIYYDYLRRERMKIVDRTSASPSVASLGPPSRATPELVFATKLSDKDASQSDSYTSQSSFSGEHESKRGKQYGEVSSSTSPSPERKSSMHKLPSSSDAAALDNKSFDKKSRKRKQKQDQMQLSERKLMIKKKLQMKVEDVDKVYRDYTNESITRREMKPATNRGTLHQSRSQQVLPERRQKLVKDSAKEEQKMREKFEDTSRELNRVISQRCPIIAVPDERVEILDLVPRMDIIEDQFFRKSIPKSTRLYKYRKNFSDAGENVDLHSSIKFMKAMVKDSLHEARERDVKYSMNADIPRKKTVLDMQTSKSTVVSKRSIHAQTKDKIFGGHYQLQLPEGTPLIEMLKLLNEDQLYDLNVKICEQYRKELEQRLEAEASSDDEGADEMKAPSTKQDPSPIPEKAEEHISDPVLDIFKMQLLKDFGPQTPKQEKKKSHEESTSVQGSRKGQAFNSSAKKERKNSILEKVGTVAKFPTLDASEMSKTNSEIRASKQYNSMRNLLSSSNNQVPSQKRDTAASPDTFGKFNESSNNFNYGIRSPNTSSMRSSRVLFHCKKVLKALERKFKKLNSYQELVNVAILEAVGQEKSVREAFRQADDVTFATSAFNKKLPTLRNLQLQQQPKSISQEPISSLDAAQKRAKYNKMISRHDAMQQLAKLSHDDNLPQALMVNTIQAEPLLFREAQLNYSKRRRMIQRQIVIDNLHFCTQQKILSYAKFCQGDEEKKARHAEVKERANEYIRKELKRKLKGDYQAMVDELEEREKREIERQAQDLRDMIVGIDLDFSRAEIQKKHVSLSKNKPAGRGTAGNHAN